MLKALIEHERQRQVESLEIAISLSSLVEQDDSVRRQHRLAFALQLAHAWNLNFKLYSVPREDVELALHSEGVAVFVQRWVECHRVNIMFSQK